MVQLVEHLTSAQIMISKFVSSSPTSARCCQPVRAEPASDHLSPSICPSPPPYALPAKKEEMVMIIKGIVKKKKEVIENNLMKTILNKNCKQITLN